MIVATEIKLSKKELDDLLHTLDKSYFYFQESLKEKVNPMMKKSKKIVGNKLRKRSGVDTGIYTITNGIFLLPSCSEETTLSFNALARKRS